jgi:hypothetical protein
MRAFSTSWALSVASSAHAGDVIPETAKSSAPMSKTLTIQQPQFIVFMFSPFLKKMLMENHTNHKNGASASGTEIPRIFFCYSASISPFTFTSPMHLLLLNTHKFFSP